MKISWIVVALCFCKSTVVHFTIYLKPSPLKTTPEALLVGSKGFALRQSHHFRVLIKSNVSGKFAT